MVEVVAEDQRVAGDGALGDEAEGDAVLVVGVRRVGEVGGCGGGAFGEACDGESGGVLEDGDWWR